MRTGGIFETLKYDHPVTALQFDTRKIVAATGENGLDLYNRTSMQHSRLLTNGHTRPAERLRYMDKYLVSGGRDATVEVLFAHITWNFSVTLFGKIYQHFSEIRSRTSAVAVGLY